MTQAEREKIVHLMKCGSLQGIDTGRLDGKCEDVIPTEDAIAIIDKVYKAEKPETCKGCLEPCIMYEPDMRACKKKVTERGEE